MEVYILEILEVIGKLITDLGFPIVACGGLFWFLNKQEERRTNEVMNMSNALNENTSVLESLKELIQVLVNKES